MTDVKKAVVLLSGGLDSATCVALAQTDGYDVHGISFRYGQRHAVELEAARQIANFFDINDHKVTDIDLRAFGGSALTDDIEVPKDRDAADFTDGIPITYVPARNTIFLSFALAYAEVIGAHDIFIGVNALDYSGYPDCRPEYIGAFEVMANLATRAGIEDSQPLRLRTPLIALTKAEIINLGVRNGVDYSLTVSCYDPDDIGRACGHCDSCQLRSKGFLEAGISDPTHYQPGAGPE